MSKTLSENIIEGCDDCDFCWSEKDQYSHYKYFKCHHPYSSIGKIDDEYLEKNIPHSQCPLRIMDYSLKLKEREEVK